MRILSSFTYSKTNDATQELLLLILTGDGVYVYKKKTLFAAKVTDPEPEIDR